MRPTLCLANRKSFVAPELFTGLCGELREALLAAGGITLETVSELQEYTASPIQIGKPNLRGRATIGATDSHDHCTLRLRTQIIFSFFQKRVARHSERHKTKSPPPPLNLAARVATHKAEAPKQGPPAHARSRKTTALTWTAPRRCARLGRGNGRHAGHPIFLTSCWNRAYSPDL